METVKESKLNPHKTHNDSESIHLNVDTHTDTPFKPTSQKINKAMHVVIIMHKLVINCAPLTPTFLPKNPETIEPNKGNTIIAKYIIYIL
jgi:hypothetical protein